MVYHKSWSVCAQLPVSCERGLHCFMTSPCIHSPETVHAAKFCHSSRHDKSTNSMTSFYTWPCTDEIETEWKWHKVHSNTGMHIYTPGRHHCHPTLPYKGRRSSTFPGPKHLSSVYCQLLDVIGLELTSGPLQSRHSSALRQVVFLPVLR